jgi:hypothetical protein
MHSSLARNGAEQEARDLIASCLIELGWTIAANRLSDMRWEVDGTIADGRPFHMFAFAGFGVDRGNMFECQDLQFFRFEIGQVPEQPRRFALFTNDCFGYQAVGDDAGMVFYLGTKTGALASASNSDVREGLIEGLRACESFYNKEKKVCRLIEEPWRSEGSFSMEPDGSFVRKSASVWRWFSYLRFWRREDGPYLVTCARSL